MLHQKSTLNPTHQHVLSFILPASTESPPHHREVQAIWFPNGVARRNIGKTLGNKQNTPPRKPKKGTDRFETTSYNRQPHPQPSIRGNFTTCPLDTFIQKACSLSSAGSALANHSVSFVYLYTSSTISLSIGG